MIYSFIIIIINPPVQVAAPPLYEQPIVQRLEKQPPEPSAINWHCPKCNWFNAYDNMTSFKIGHKRHLRGCPNR